MKVLIIEDEKPAARRIKTLLENASGVNLVGVVESVKRGKEWFNTNSLPDLIFSDIQLGDGLSFEIFKELGIKTPIIFTTAYNEYALEAFKHNSIAYLLKPFVQEDINESIAKFKDFPSSSNINFSDLIAQIRGEETKSYRNRFLIEKGDQMISLQVDEVSYIYSEDKATLLKDLAGNRFFIKGSLDEIGQELNPKEFFRINRSMLVHHQSIDKISNYFGGTLKLDLKPGFDGEVSVSRRRVSEFKDWLNH